MDTALLQPLWRVKHACRLDCARTSPHSGRTVMKVHMQHDLSPGRWEVCNSASESTRFLQSCQSRLEHQGFPDGNQSCCWWNIIQRMYYIQSLPPVVTSKQSHTLLNCTTFNKSHILTAGYIADDGDVIAVAVAAGDWLAAAANCRPF